MRPLLLLLLSAAICLAQSAGEAYREVSSLMQRGDFSAAAIAADRALRREPDSVALLNLAGILADQRGDTDRAIDLFGKAVRLRPGFADARSNLGLALFHSGQSQAAISEYERVLAANPNHPASTLGLAEALFVATQFDRALPVARRARFQDPKNADATLLLARIQFARNAEAEASTLLTGLVGRFGHDAAMLSAIGLTLLEDGRYSPAAMVLEKSAALDAANPEAIHGAAVALGRSRKVDRATEFLRSWLERNPVDAQGHYLLGACLQMQGRNAEAEAEFRRAIELKGSLTSAIFQLGVGLFTSGRVDEAAAQFDEVLRRDPGRVAAVYYKGLVALDRRDYDEAGALFSRVVASQPDNAPAHFNLAKVLRRKGQSAAAERETAAFRDLQMRREKSAASQTRLYDGATSDLALPGLR